MINVTLTQTSTKRPRLLDEYLNTLKRRPEPSTHGRYAVTWCRGGVVFGHRFSSKSLARAFARWKLGRARPGLSVHVIRFRWREWICPPDGDAPGILRIDYLGAAPQPESPFVQRQIEAIAPPVYAQLGIDAEYVGTPPTPEP